MRVASPEACGLANVVGLAKLVGVEPRPRHGTPSPALLPECDSPPDSHTASAAWVVAVVVDPAKARGTATVPHKSRPAQRPEPTAAPPTPRVRRTNHPSPALACRVRRTAAQHYGRAAPAHPMSVRPISVRPVLVGASGDDARGTQPVTPPTGVDRPRATLALTDFAKTHTRMAGARTRARTHMRTRVRTHTRMHASTHTHAHVTPITAATTSTPTAVTTTTAAAACPLRLVGMRRSDSRQHTLSHAHEHTLTRARVRAHTHALLRARSRARHTAAHARRSPHAHERPPERLRLALGVAAAAALVAIRWVLDMLLRQWCGMRHRRLRQCR